MNQTPDSWPQLESFLKRRHRILMSARPEALPGQFKERANRAGSTQFVRPDLVPGTLEQGFDLYRALSEGIARIMMNAELQSQGLGTIIIPNVYREDYLTSLRALSRRDRAAPLVRMSLRAQAFSNLDFTSYPKILKTIQDRRWFAEPGEATIIE